MRIISLHAAVTAWLQMFGLDRALVSIESSDRESAAVAVTRTTGLDESSGARGGAVEDPFEPGPLSSATIEGVRRADADLVVLRSRTQAEALSRAGGEATTFVFAPRTLPEVLKQALALGRACGRGRDAMAAVGRLETELLAAQRRGGFSRKSGIHGEVVLLSSLRPLRAGGYWIDDLLEQAGAVPRPDTRGTPPKRFDPADIERLNPRQILIASDGDTQVPTGAGYPFLSVPPGTRASVLPPHLTLFDPSPALYATIHFLIEHFQTR